MRALIAFLFLSISGGAALIAQTPAPAAKPKPAAAVKPAGLYGVMVTSMGTITFQLFEKEAPQTVKNFVELCLGLKEWRDPETEQMVKRPLIPGTTFHRVIPGFMIQGGDPTGTGSGEVGFVIPDEPHPDLKYDRPGRFGMANRGPQTSSSQFFITETPQPHLDGGYTIFGQVLAGQPVVNRIARVATGENNKPLMPVVIESVKFQRVGPRPANAPEPAPVRRAVPKRTSTKSKTATSSKKK